MPLILCECELLRFRHRPPNWILMIKVIFKFISSLMPWLVCTIFFATILLQLRTHTSKNYSPTFLPGFILISFIILPTNTPRMKNQFVLTTLPFLHFNPTIHLIFPKYFFVIFFLCNPKFLPQRRAKGSRKGSQTENDRRPEGGLEALNEQEAIRAGERPQLLPPFLGSPDRKQLAPLPTFEAG